MKVEQENKNNSILSKCRKFFTGYGANKEKEQAKNTILAEIENKVDLLAELGWIDHEKVETKKLNIKKKAEENNWKGNIVIRKNPKGQLFVIYKPEYTGIQHIGRGASSSIKGNL